MYAMKDDFFKQSVRIAVPVALQAMLQSSFSMIDQVMVGQLGSRSIAAMEIAGKPGFILTFVTGAVATIAGIMVSQYLGKGDYKAVGRAVSVNVATACLVAALFTVVVAGCPLKLSSLFTDSSAVASESAAYLRIIAFSFLPNALALIPAVYVRCLNKAQYPLYASFAAALVNTGLNWLLIFGHFGAPALGIRGAAIASVVSSLINLAIILAIFALMAKRQPHSLNWSLSLGKAGYRQFALMLIPVVANEFFWSVGQSVNTFIYAHLGTEELAAMSLTGPVQGLFIGALSGISQAAGILIGKRLGQKDYDSALNESKRLCWYGLIGSVALSLVLIAVAAPYTRLYHVEPSVCHTAVLLLAEFAVLAPVKVLNMILGGGIVRSGGQTKYIMIIDMAGTWLVGIPLALITAFVLKMPIVWVYFILSQEEAVRLIITIFIFKSRRWMNTIN